MEIMLNGTPTHTQAATLAELLEEQGIATPGTAVAVDGKVVRRTSGMQRRCTTVRRSR